MVFFAREPHIYVVLVGSLGFQAEVNIDSEQPTHPGTALVWKKSGLAGGLAGTIHAAQHLCPKWF